MSDDAFYSPNHKPTPPQQPRPRTELLFEFVRPSNHAPMSCALLFHGESYGWEALFYERGELFISHGGFALRAMAIHWAEAERKAMETETWTN